MQYLRSRPDHGKLTVWDLGGVFAPKTLTSLEGNFLSVQKLHRWRYGSNLFTLSPNIIFKNASAHLSDVTLIVDGRYTLNFFFNWCYNPLWVCILQPFRGAIASSRTRFLDHTQRRATVGRTPLDEWSVRRRDLYLTTHTTDKYPCPQWDSNPRSQQASGHRPIT
jgi:hypothetical protein